MSGTHSLVVAVGGVGTPRNQSVGGYRGYRDPGRGRGSREATVARVVRASPALSSSFQLTSAPTAPALSSRQRPPLQLSAHVSAHRSSSQLTSAPTPPALSSRQRPPLQLSAHVSAHRSSSQLTSAPTAPSSQLTSAPTAPVLSSCQRPPLQLSAHVSAHSSTARTIKSVELVSGSLLYVRQRCVRPRYRSPSRYRPK